MAVRSLGKLTAPSPWVKQCIIFEMSFLTPAYVGKLNGSPKGNLMYTWRNVFNTLKGSKFSVLFYPMFDTFWKIRYAYIVCINSYLHDRFKCKLAVWVFFIVFPLVLSQWWQDNTSFSSWLADRGEIGLWMENCRTHPLDAVKLPAILATNHNNAQVFENRAGHDSWISNFNILIVSFSGSVLVPLSVLKGDYFPGAQRHDLLPILEGAPNFRFIESMRIVGVAVPKKVSSYYSSFQPKLISNQRSEWKTLLLKSNGIYLMLNLFGWIWEKSLFCI